MLLAAATLAGCSGGDLDEPEMTASSSASTASGSSGSSAKAAATTTAQAASKSDGPDCSIAALDRSFGKRESAWTYMELCEGNFAYVGQQATDNTFPVQWTGEKWELIEDDGYISEGMGQACYDQETIDDLGIGPRVAARMVKCKASSSGSKPQSSSSSGGGVKVENGIIKQVVWEYGEVYPASNPACDGRNILILESVIDNTGDVQNALSKLGAAMAYAGGEKQAEFTVPGHCSSLRAYAEGGNVYPVYLDFGSNQAAMCAAKAKYGGNGRTLNNSGDFSDPC